MLTKNFTGIEGMSNESEISSPSCHILPGTTVNSLVCILAFCLCHIILTILKSQFTNNLSILSICTALSKSPMIVSNNTQDTNEKVTHL